MSTRIISIANDFSRFPSGRFRTDGPHSGQQFREDFLAPALEQNEKVVVDLDGVAGLPASFLEEAFGGLVRSHGYVKSMLATRLEFIASTPRMRTYPQQIVGYIDRAGTPLVAAE